MRAIYIAVLISIFRLERRGFEQDEARRLATAEIDRGLAADSPNFARRRTLLLMGVGLGISLGFCLFVIGVILTIVTKSSEFVSVAFTLAVFPWGVALVQLLRLLATKGEEAAWRRRGEPSGWRTPWIFLPSWIDLALGVAVALACATIAL